MAQLAPSRKKRIDWEKLLPSISALAGGGFSVAEIMSALQLDCKPNTLRATLRKNNISIVARKKRKRGGDRDLTSDKETALDSAVTDAIRRFKTITNKGHDDRILGLSGIPVPQDLLLQYLTDIGSPVQITDNGIVYNNRMYPCWGLLLTRLNLKRALANQKCIRLV